MYMLSKVVVAIVGSACFQLIVSSRLAWMDRSLLVGSSVAFCFDEVEGVLRTTWAYRRTELL